MLCNIQHGLFNPFYEWMLMSLQLCKNDNKLQVWHILFIQYTPPWVQHTSYSAAPASLNHPDRILKTGPQTIHLHHTYQHPFIISSIFGVICCHFYILSREWETTFCSSTKQLRHILIHTHIHVGLKACYFDRFYMLKYFQKVYGHFDILFSTSVALIKSNHNLFSKINNSVKLYYKSGSVSLSKKTFRFYFKEHSKLNKNTQDNMVCCRAAGRLIV